MIILELISAQDVTVQFGGVIANNKVNMVLKEGEILALIGPNGAGKTTFFNAITGFQKPTSGTIKHLDTDITGWPAHKVADRGIIRTFQKTMIFNTVTVEFGILMATHRLANHDMMGALLRSRKFKEDEANLRKHAEEIMKFVGLYKRKDILGKNLAYGEQRILEIAIALATKPAILMLDEPAAGLNSEETKELMKIISKIRESGVTILLVEHNMNIVMNISDRIIVLNQGNKIAEGLPEEIQANPLVLQAYLGGEQYA